MATKKQAAPAAPDPATICQHPEPFGDDGVCIWCRGFYSPKHDSLSALQLQLIECEQNSEEWYQSRAGVMTASEFHTVMARGRTASDRESVTRRKYMLTLVGETIAGRCSPFARYQGGAMVRGHEFEQEARDYYALVTGHEVQRVGFYRRGDIGCSPDGVVGDDGLVQIKTKEYHLQLECLLQDRVPPEHLPQLQGELLVTGRKWNELVSYAPGLPLFRKKVYRDDAYMARQYCALSAFRSEMQELLAKVRGIAA